MSDEPTTDLDHARYDRDGWLETALAAQQRIAGLEAENARLRQTLTDCRATIANSNPGITDTVWFGRGETLLDRIDHALGRVKEDYQMPPVWEERALAAEAEVKRLRARLEIDHAWNGKGEKVPFPEGMEHLDGIECRDETIRCLEAEIKKLRAVIGKASA